MKIAILTSTFLKFSGIDRVVEQQATSLVGEGNEVTVFTLNSDINPKGYNVVTIGMPQSLLWQRIYRLLFFFDIKKINSTVKKLKGCDVIFSHQYPMNIIALKAKNTYKSEYVYYNHGIAPAETFQTITEKIYIRLFRLLTNWTVKGSDRVISISKYLADILKRETGLESEIRYNTIDTQRFHMEVRGDRIREKYNIGNAPMALYVGRISPHKGIHTLLKAFKRVSEAIPTAKLVIAGKPTFESYRRDLDDLATDAVIFVGFVSDEELPEYYAACDVYTTASGWEGYDLPIAEAHACGKPVVAFDLCAHPEVVQEGDVLIEPGNGELFTRALVQKLKKES